MKTSIGEGETLTYTGAVSGFVSADNHFWPVGVIMNTHFSKGTIKSLSQKYLYGHIVREVSDGCYVLYGNNWYLTVITAKF